LFCQRVIIEIQLGFWFGSVQRDFNHSSFVVLKSGQMFLGLKIDIFT